MNSFNSSKLSPILEQLCAIKITKKDGVYVGIGKLTFHEQKPVIYFECAALLKKSRILWLRRARNKHEGMRVCGTVNSYTMHFQATGIDLNPEDWQKVTMEGGDVFLSFHEKDIREIDAFLDYHTKGRT